MELDTLLLVGFCFLILLTLASAGMAIRQHYIAAGHSQRLQRLENGHEIHLQVHEEMGREFRAIHNVIPFRRKPRQPGGTA